MRVIGPQDLEIVPAPPAFLRPMERAHELRICVAGIGMNLRFDDERVRDRMALRYRHLRSSQPPSLQFSCASYDGAQYFWCDEGTTWRWPALDLPMDAVVLFVDATAMSSLVRSDPELVSFHAAAVRCGEVAAAIVGDSTAGKTTTTLACARTGMHVFSDERLLMRSDCLVLPFLRAFNVRAHGAALLAQDDAADEFGQRLAQRSIREDWNDVSPIEVFSQPMPAPCPLRAVFLLDGKAAQVSLRQMESLRAAPRMLASIDCAQFDRLDRTARVLAMLRRTAVFRLTLGTPAESARAIAAALQNLTRDAA